MKREHAGPGRRATVVIACALIAALVIVSILLATSTFTTTSTTTSSPRATGGLITAGPSRSECFTPNFDDTGLAALQAAVTSFNTLTDSSVTCVSAYIDSATTWANWESPWITHPSYGYTSWVAEAPQSRQLVLAVQLIPNELANVNNPLKWEKSCASGGFNSYARRLGASLVAAGLENSVIRLGNEMNGVWETDFIGTTKVEQKLWAKCFSNEVASFREVTGEHFLIDWNVNACKGNYPYANYYPGNSYVDIVGIDLYDVGCKTPFTRFAFSKLASEQLGLDHFEAFAAEKGKPMSFGEWGLASVPAGDDPAYINGIGSTVKNGDFAFEAYFDGGGGPNSKALALTSGTPLALTAYQNWFGNGSK